MLYALWINAGLLAAILLVLIVMLRDYNPALTSLSSQVDQIRRTVEHNYRVMESELGKQTKEIINELRELKPDWKEHRELIDTIEKIGADGTHLGDHLRWIANNVHDIENHTALTALNTAPSG